MNFSLDLGPDDLVVLRLLQWALHQRPLEGPAARDLQEAGAPITRDLELLGIDSLLYLATGQVSSEQRVYDLVLAAQLGELRTVLQQLVDRSCAPIVFKGTELVPRSFGGRAIGSSRDIDILVPRDRLHEAARALRERGYEQAALVDPATPLLERLQRVDGETTGPSPILIPEASGEAMSGRVHADYAAAPFARFLEIDLPGELGPTLARMTAARPGEVYPLPLHGVAWLTGPTRARILVTIDPHYRTSTLYTPDGLVRRAVGSHHGVGRTFCPADHLWVTLLKWYTELQRFGDRRLRPLAQVGALVARSEIDWRIVTGVAEALDVGPCLYYPLAILAMLDDGDLIPPAVLEALDPRRLRGPKRAFDFGWQLDKLFRGALEPVLPIGRPLPRRAIAGPSP